MTSHDASTFFFANRTTSSNSKSTFSRNNEEFLFANSLSKMRKSLESEGNLTMTLRDEANAASIGSHIAILVSKESRVEEITEIQLDTMSQLNQKVAEIAASIVNLMDNSLDCCYY